MEEFKKEVHSMATSDIMLILEDQLDLYNEEEIQILKSELASRPSNALEIEAKENEQRQEQFLQREFQREYDEQEQIRIKNEEQQRKEREKQYQTRLSKLKETGSEGYYEYKVISMLDESGLFRKNSGKVDTIAMTQTLNELGLDGWHLVTAYPNELGKNALSGGAGGAIFGVNSTVDENILIFERFVKIKG